MENQEGLKPPPSELSFRELQAKASNTLLKPDDRAKYVEERFARRDEVLAADPGFHAWLKGKVESTLRQGRWGTGPEDLFAQAKALEEQAAQHVGALSNHRVNLVSSRYSGLVESVVITTSEIASLARDDNNEKDAAKKAELKKNIKKLETRNENLFGITISGEETQKEMDAVSKDNEKKAQAEAAQKETEAKVAEQQRKDREAKEKAEQAKRDKDQYEALEKAKKDAENQKKQREAAEAKAAQEAENRRLAAEAQRKKDEEDRKKEEKRRHDELAEIEKKKLEQQKRDQDLKAQELAQRQADADRREKQDKERKEKADADAKAKEFPKSPEAQYELIMGLVHEVEMSTWPIAKHHTNEASFVDPRQIKEIKDLIFREECNPRVREEALARLRIHDSVYVMKSAANYSKQAQIDYLKGAYSDNSRKEWGFQPADATTLAESPNLRVGLACDIYARKLREGVAVNGQQIDLNARELDPKIKNVAMYQICEEIYKYENQKAKVLEKEANQLSGADQFAKQQELQSVVSMLSKMGKELLTMEEEAKNGEFIIRKNSVLAKSLDMADRILEVWGEKSVLDTKGDGKGLIWSLVNLDKYRSRGGSDPGPLITIPFLPHLGVSSFARMGTQKYDIGRPLVEAQYVFLPQVDPAKERLEQNFQQAINQRIRGIGSNGELVPVSLNTVDWRACPPTAWLDYIGQKLPKAIELREVITTSTWSTKDLNTDRLDAVRGLISDVVGLDTFRISAMFFLGVETDSLWREDTNQRPGDLGWDTKNRTNLTGHALKSKLLTKEEFRWVENNQGKDPSRIRTLPPRRVK